MAPIAFPLFVVISLGCTTPLMGNLGWKSKVTAIEIEGVRNLNDAKVRITDSDEVEKVTGLVRKIRRGFIFASVNFDISKAKIVRLRLISANGSTDLDIISGMMDVPGDDEWLFYDSDPPARIELWELLLAHLGQEDEE